MVKEKNCNKEKAERVYYNNAKIKNLCVKNLNAQTLSADIANFQVLGADNADIKNLTVQTINGQSFEKPVCDSYLNVESSIDPVEFVEIEGSISNNVLTVSQIFSGNIAVGQYLLAQGITLGTLIVGVQGNNYLLNNNLQLSNRLITLYVKPVKDGVNEEVMNGLWDNTLFNLQDVLIPNLQCGRARNQSISDFYNCNICPPSALSGCDFDGNASITGSLTGNVLTISSLLSGTIQLGQVLVGENIKTETTIVGILVPNQSYRISIPQNLSNRSFLLLSNCPQTDCPTVPMKIYGIETITPGIWDSVCGLNKVLSTLSYNLDVINRSINLSERAVAVFLQVGWIENNIFTLREIDLGIRQFNPSLAAVLGEQFSANLILPSALMERVIAAMPPIIPNNSAAVQLVVYVEDGIQIFSPPMSERIREFARLDQNPTPNVAYTYFNSFLAVTLITQNSQNPYLIPMDMKMVRLTGIGGGGGGGSAISLSVIAPVARNAYYPGGGGARGFQVDSVVVDVVQTGARFISFTIGNGGVADTDGGFTTFTFLDQNQNPIAGLTYTAQGGGAGQKGVDHTIFNSSGNGGNGSFGGGGGAISPWGSNPRPGIGGSVGGHDGTNEKGGDGGAANITETPGIGGVYPPESFSNDPYSGYGANGGGGGGGGGNGGGNGGGVGHTNGYDAQRNTGAGGGGAAGFAVQGGYNNEPPASGGKGAAGFIYFSGTR